MEAPTPLTDRDEALLKRIAEVSGGRYYRAADDEGLSRVMREVDKLEKTELVLHEVRSYRELYPLLVAPAVALLALELALGATWLRRVP
jgi:Ca-activated chloride channel family protein